MSETSEAQKAVCQFCGHRITVGPGVTGQAVWQDEAPYQPARCLARTDGYAHVPYPETVSPVGQSGDAIREPVKADLLAGLPGAERGTCAHCGQEVHRLGLPNVPWFTVTDSASAPILLHIPPEPRQTEYGDTTCTRCGQRIGWGHQSQRWIARGSGMFVCKPADSAHPASETYPEEPRRDRCQFCHLTIMEQPDTTWRDLSGIEPARCSVNQGAHAPPAPGESLTDEELVDATIWPANPHDPEMSLAGGLYLYRCRRCRRELTREDAGHPWEAERIDSECPVLPKPPRGTRFVYSAERIDPDDPAPGVRLLFAGTLLGRLSDREATALAIDLLTAVRDQ